MLPTDRKVFLIILFSSKLNLNNFHWTTDTQTRGKLGNEEAGLIPSTRNISRALQRWWRLNSRNVMEQTVETDDEHTGWGGLDSRVKQWKPRPSFTSCLPFGIAPPLTACQYPAHPSRLSPNTLSMKPSWSHSLPAGFLRLCLHFFWRTCPILLNNLYACT